MRIKRSRLTEHYLMKRITGKDAECNTYEDWDIPVPFIGEAWQASGKVQVQQYGERLNYIKNLRIEGDYNIVTEKKRVSYDFGDGLIFSENDGICVYTETEPDYKIIAIKPYKPLLLELEKI